MSANGGAADLNSDLILDYLNEPTNFSEFLSDSFDANDAGATPATLDVKTDNFSSSSGTLASPSLVVSPPPDADTRIETAFNFSSMMGSQDVHRSRANSGASVMSSHSGHSAHSAVQHSPYHSPYIAPLQTEQLSPVLSDVNDLEALTSSVRISADPQRQPLYTDEVEFPAFAPQPAMHTDALLQDVFYSAPQQQLYADSSSPAVVAASNGMRNHRGVSVDSLMGPDLSKIYSPQPQQFPDLVGADVVPQNPAGAALGQAMSQAMSPAFSPNLTVPVRNRARSRSDSQVDRSSLASSLSYQDSFLSPQAAALPDDRQGRSPRSDGSASPRSNHSRSRSTSRDYILDLAKSRGSKTVQKHPRLYRCDLCDKAFTRAYNLRSHKRTHTDERPFICAVCGKAFARQHDKKRHEELHTGEKKFQCRGLQADGVTKWGCGRRFARADALARHFRTEGGRECVRPLLEEEAKLSGEQNVSIAANSNMPGLTVSPPEADAGDRSNSGIPMALLRMYPGLAGVDGSLLMSGGSDMGGSDVGGTSDFDGSDYYEEDNS